LRPFLRKAWSFLRILRWTGHPILRPFLRKAWSFLRILRWAGHPILRPFLRKAWSFLRILRGACCIILKLLFCGENLNLKTTDLDLPLFMNIGGLFLSFLSI